MPGFFDSTTGNTIPETYLDDYVNAQVVMRYASAAARDADVILTAALREGMVCYLVDTDVLAYYTGAAWVEFFRGTARRAYAPTLNQSATVTYTAAAGSTTYDKRGREVRCQFDLAVTSAGSAGTDIAVELPFAVAAAMVGAVIGQAFIYDASTANVYDARLVATSTTYTKFMTPAESGGGGIRYIGNGLALTLASGDVLRGQAFYDAAA